ncbi:MULTISPECIES: CHAP domain-containing protein [Mammaliicoccus]|jgi:surface antigen|uniref:CHAP domain-containing protein n=1 Tax=Mammaliicoccus lentus TaxID=42858 RepID=A0AAP1RTN9_MAMLE|nr:MULTISPECIES: CHAP domain-containing protein [Mammaliicoccus]HBV04743.1 CHAP domain-containing protein [Staphylococcus sp.]MBF0748285.1 CHAP domain-containing protein [Mammaliicoccus lentus]MBF0794073.1 CHAP domain-containing protein [Mammaliicoccus lentus]MBF0842757.1 CHAP domain-containing protein [Mammaliicoccus lentus]MBU6114944.1 CHAP domain-containing protein [Mammaliicoccus lentus]
MKKLTTIAVLTTGLATTIIGNGEASADTFDQNQNVQQTQTQNYNYNYTSNYSQNFNTSNMNGSINSSFTQTATQTTGSSANLYTAGQCTYYIFDKKMEDGDPISSTWGNANQWASNAAADGHTVNNTPKEGSILQSSAGAFGHVAYVENVNSDGSIEVSEMNYQGEGVVSSRTISASEAGSYNYIH